MERSVAVLSDHDAMEKVREFVGTDNNNAAVDAIGSRFTGETHPRILELEEEIGDHKKRIKQIDTFDMCLKDVMASRFFEGAKYEQLNDEQKQEIDLLFDDADTETQKILSEVQEG